MTNQRRNLRIEVFREGRSYYHREYWEFFSERHNRWLNASKEAWWPYWTRSGALRAAKRKVREAEQAKIVIAEVK